MTIQRVLVSMPDKFLNDIDQVANDENRSRSELIREALRQYMKSNNMNFNVNDLTALKWPTNALKWNILIK